MRSFHQFLRQIFSASLSVLSPFMTTVSGHRHPAAMIARRASGCPHGWPCVPRLAQAGGTRGPERAPVMRSRVGARGWAFLFIVSREGQTKNDKPKYKEQQESSR